MSELRVSEYLGGCTGKVAFATRSIAAQVAKRRSDRACKPGTAYHCSHCDKWHIGRNNPRAKGG